MVDRLRSELIARDSFVKSDNSFQRRARLLQCLWRESAGLEPGEQKGKVRGTRLVATTDPAAGLTNFLTPGIGEIAQLELAEIADPETDRRWSTDRMRFDLMASQPMIINLLGELIVDPAALGKVLAGFWPDEVAEVTAVELRRPGLSVPGFVDVLVEVLDGSGTAGMIGMRVRYSENFRVGFVEPNPKWDKIATGPEEMSEPPLQQVWIDYLSLREVAAAAKIAPERVRFVQIQPSENFRAGDVAGRFLDVANVVGLDDRCDVITLEAFVEAISEVIDAPWVYEFAERYLGFELVDELLDLAEAGEAIDAIEALEGDQSEAWEQWELEDAADLAEQEAAAAAEPVAEPVSEPVAEPVVAPAAAASSPPVSD